jgi:cold shock CspA family protein
MGKKPKNNNQDTLDNFDDINQKFLELVNEKIEPEQPGVLPGGRLLGYLKIYFKNKYGFITLDKNDIYSREKHENEYFMLPSEIIDKNYRDSLARGQRVSFIPAKNSRGSIAKNVMILPNTPDFETANELQEKLKEV